MSELKCENCGDSIENGLHRGGMVFCSDECEEEDWETVEFLTDEY